MKKRKGLTLVELLIVMAIIGLIMAMTIPSFYMAARKTRRAICLNNLRVLNDASQRYCLDEKKSDLTGISQEELINFNYLNEKLKCPEGDVEYNSFIISNGPVCPDLAAFPDHKLED